MRIVWDAVKFASWKGLLYGAGFGALVGSIFALISGTLIGFVVGGLIGNVLGVVEGLLIGCVIQRYFNPLTDIKRFRWTLYYIPAISTEVVVICLLLISGQPSDSILDYVSRFVALQFPAFIIAGAAVYAGQEYADHYIGQLIAQRRLKRKLRKLNQDPI